jgi:corrinoid protein of di/trimethylamine methyltransferase
MTTQRDRMLLAARGEMTDILPFAPRIDLWFHANKTRGTLPPQYRSAESADEIALAEGWALHKVILEFVHFGLDAIVDRVLGIYRIPTQGFLTHLPEDVERRVEQKGDEIHVEYKTPKGVVSGTIVYTEDMRQAGISIPWIKEHAIKDARDYEVLGYIFENMRVEAAYDGFSKWSDGIGENGLPVLYALTAGSPMHHIMKILLDATDFYYRHRDQKTIMEGLADKIGVYFKKVFEVVAESPAEVILVGANFDDMLTYPPFFKEYIAPWLREASGVLHNHGKLMLCHTDGENLGLMDLLADCGMDIADAVCPYPMTKVTVGEYYRRWCDKITIFGGIPSNILLEDIFSNEAFEAYMAELFDAIAPGTRFILGIADTTPPDASLERIRRIQEMVSHRGQLPIKCLSTADGVKSEAVAADSEPETGTPAEMIAAAADTALPFCDAIQKSVLDGDQEQTTTLSKQAIDAGGDPDHLIKQCLLPPMDVIGERFSDGTVFIPEVLLSARALNAGMGVIEPFLHKNKAGRTESPLVVLCTVKGDLHDIGKNLVGIMFRSVGLRVNDLGTNVGVGKIVEAVQTHQPKILALSALLTTTMAEFVKIIDALTEAGLRERVKIIVGGAPVSSHFAQSIGADGYGADAGEAAQLAKRLCGM